MRSLLMLGVVLALTACASGYQRFYKPYGEPESLTDVELLQPGEEPEVYGTNNFNKDIRTLRSKMYTPIGFSSFNGGYEGINKVKAQAKRVGATVVLVNSQYTNTQTTTSSLLIPDSSTTYSSGTIYGGGLYGSYSGTSTTYGTTVVPITTEKRRYDQTAIFFVKSTKKSKFGVFTNNLNDAQRREMERNTGAVIEVVVEESPAFYANIIPGDILIKVNGIEVRDAPHAMKLMSDVNSNDMCATFTVIRNGKEKDVELVIYTPLQLQRVYEGDNIIRCD